MKIFWNIFVSATVLATFSKFWANFSKSSGHPDVLQLQLDHGFENKQK
jgi:hypothetical protein